MKQPEKIDAYLMGKLSAEEAKAFSDELQQNRALAEEVNTRKQLILGIQSEGRQELRESLDAIHEQLQPKADPIPRSIIRRLSPWLAAAAVALLALLFWFQSRPATNQQLYAANYTPYELSLNLRNNNEADKVNANNWYSQGHFDQALPLFQKLSAEHPEQGQFRMGLAICLLETQQKTAAQKELLAIYNSGDIFLKEQAGWYLGLIALSNDQLTAAKTYWTPLANNPQADHHSDAQKLLAVLENK